MRRLWSSVPFRQALGLCGVGVWRGGAQGLGRRGQAQERFRDQGDPHDHGDGQRRSRPFHHSRCRRTRYGTGFLEGLQQPAVAPDAADTVVLVVSELVTNALRHGGGRCTVELTAHPDTIEVAVHDPSRHVPRMRTPDLNGGTGGFGWPMVTGLAHATAVTRGASGGKTVSAFLAWWRHRSSSRRAGEYNLPRVEA